MANPKKSNRDEFLSLHGISGEEFQKTTLTWDELDAIKQDHEQNKDNLRRTAEIVAEFLRGLGAVHSVKSRVKNSDHLVAKVIRKRIEEPARIIDAKNYREEITDLTGVRALHLFKQEWPAIHQALVDEYDFSEAPVAYYRDGDAKELLEQYKAVGCDPKVHGHHYRSVHYLLKTPINKKAATIVEAQVRTVFEEGWAEIDHRVRYPRKTDDPVISSFVGIFNMLSGGADEMASFLITLKAHLEAQKAETERARSELATRTKELNRTISKLQVSEEEKGNLKKQVTDVTTPSLGHPWSSLNLDTTHKHFTETFDAVKALQLPKLYSDLSVTPSSIGAMLSPNFGATRTVTCLNGHTWQVNSAFGAIGAQCPLCGQAGF